MATKMRFFSSPNFVADRDVLCVVCDECDMLASEIFDGVPLCPDHAEKRRRSIVASSLDGIERHLGFCEDSSSLFENDHARSRVFILRQILKDWGKLED